MNTTTRQTIENVNRQLRLLIRKLPNRSVLPLLAIVGVAALGSYFWEGSHAATPGQEVLSVSLNSSRQPAISGKATVPAGSRVYVSVPSAAAKSVQFTVTDASDGEIITSVIDNTPPFDLKGDNGIRSRSGEPAALPWVPTAGHYTITARVTQDGHSDTYAVPLAVAAAATP
jgi:hypothetical protein